MKTVTLVQCHLRAEESHFLNSRVEIRNVPRVSEPAFKYKMRRLGFQPITRYKRRSVS